MKHALFTESYRGIPVTVFWMPPAVYTRGQLIYGYRIEDDLEVQGTGFADSTTACRAAAKVIDEVHSYLYTLKEAPRKVRKGSRATGTNPRALGTNPRALRQGINKAD